MLALCSCFAAAQNPPEKSQTPSKPTVIVGVAEPTNQSRVTFNPPWERDTMVRLINELKPDKKANVLVRAVALSGTSLEEVGEDAQKQHCSYVVLTLATEQNGVAGYDSAPGVPDPMSNRRPPQNPMDAAERGGNLGVQYTVYPIGKTKPLSHGILLAPTNGDGYGESEIQNAFRGVPPRVVRDIDRQPPPKPSMD